MRAEPGDSPEGLWETVERDAAEGRATSVGRLGGRLAERHAAAAELLRSHERDLAHVLRVLALTPGLAGVEELMRLFEEHPAATAHVGPRLAASLLAEAQPVADLADAVFGRGGRDRLDELRACLFHELVLRGVDTAGFPPLDAWHRYRPEWHALTWLPAERRELEEDAGFPSRSARGGVQGTDGGLPVRGRTDPPTPHAAPRTTPRDTATPEDHRRILAAATAGGWGADAWVFEFPAALGPHDVPALLPSLPMACTAGLGPHARFEVAVRPVHEIWPLLFGTASMGGMYTPGVHGAYGRLAAWQSTAGLCGAPAGASAREVERRALGSTWFHFEADTDWFHNEIHDYGIAALAPGRRRIAVLAATDTD
ncbi:DUF6183 family protein [Streptomyces sp. NPDC032940]|uniref:DUF6183 family protein n=1 Tax=Streptomyces sp. NPDC032940 TaxID=3155366 RepID=UPI00340B4FC5